MSILFEFGVTNPMSVLVTPVGPRPCIAYRVPWLIVAALCLCECNNDMLQSTDILTTLICICHRGWLTVLIPRHCQDRVNMNIVLLLSSCSLPAAPCPAPKNHSGTDKLCVGDSASSFDCAMEGP